MILRSYRNLGQLGLEEREEKVGENLDGWIGALGITRTGDQVKVGTIC